MRSATHYICEPKQVLLAQQSEGVNSRRRIFSLDVIFWSFLDQVHTPQGSCREAVRKVMAFVRRKLPKEKGNSMSPDTSSYFQARAKIPLEVMDDINTHPADRLQNHIPSAELWHGSHVKLADGTGLSMPGTGENQARWPQSKSQKPGCGFSAINLAGVFCLLSGALVKAAYGDSQTHERTLFRDLWSALNPGDLAVTDR